MSVYFLLLRDAGRCRLVGIRNKSVVAEVGGKDDRCHEKAVRAPAHHLVCDRAFTGMFYMSKRQIVFFVYYII